VEKYTKMVLVTSSRAFSHIDLAHKLWANVVQPGNIVIDSTCGNGIDSLALAQLALCQRPNNGKLYCIDIQSNAIDLTKKKLMEYGFNENVEYCNQSHETFPESIKLESVACIVYNLGYLPNSDKSVVTSSSSTIKSLAQASFLLKPGGLISVMAYRGHPGGKEEANDVEQYLSCLESPLWRATKHVQLNWPESAPVLYTCYKRC
jgi:SAM-dependent methyltransferase